MIVCTCYLACLVTVHSYNTLRDKVIFHLKRHDYSVFKTEKKLLHTCSVFQHIYHRNLGYNIMIFLTETQTKNMPALENLAPLKYNCKHHHVSILESTS